ncbi:terminase large subunit [Rheinheimera phage vB_RspM_barba_10-9I]|nr:terminase large subunit [Rheinheimera phage vB_RspM_barba_10-9I]
MLPLKYIDDPRTTAIMFRRTTPQIKGQGGLFDTAFNMYNQLPDIIKPKFRHQALESVFPTGAKVKWSHMENEKDKLNHQGLQYTFIGFDEGTQFEWSQIEYLISRMRSESKHPSRMVISCNPDPDHYIRTMIDWWLDEEGYPIPERDGMVKYFITLNGQYIWGDSKEELIEKYKTPEYTPKPISFSFISALIYDNPLMIKNNPSYLAFLEGLNEIDKARLLHGNWKVKPKGSTLFNWDWIKTADHLPYGVKSVRSYDLAGTEPSDINSHPDFTTSIMVSKDMDGKFYLSGNYHNLFCDNGSNIKGAMRKLSGERNQIMLKQAHLDSDDTYVILPQDPNSAGKAVFDEMVKFFLSNGFIVKKDPVPHTKSKIARFENFATAASNGLVYVVESSFDKPTLEFIKKSLCDFTGERSGRLYKDDIPDCVATGFNYLNVTQMIPQINLPNLTKSNEFSF